MAIASASVRRRQPSAQVFGDDRGVEQVQMPKALKDPTVRRPREGGRVEGTGDGNEAVANGISGRELWGQGARHVEGSARRERSVVMGGRRRSGGVALSHGPVTQVLNAPAPTIGKVRKGSRERGSSKLLLDPCPRPFERSAAVRRAKVHCLRNEVGPAITGSVSMTDSAAGHQSAHAVGDEDDPGGPVRVGRQLLEMSGQGLPVDLDGPPRVVAGKNGSAIDGSGERLDVSGPVVLRRNPRAIAQAEAMHEYDECIRRCGARGVAVDPSTIERPQGK